MTQRTRGFRNASAPVSIAVRSVQAAAEAAGLQADIIQFGSVDYLYLYEDEMILLVADIYENRTGVQLTVIGGNYWADFRPRFLAGLVDRGLSYTYRLPDPSGERHLVNLLQSVPVSMVEAEADLAAIAERRRVEREMMRMFRRGLNVDQACELRRLVRVYDAPEEHIIRCFLPPHPYTIAELRQHVAGTYARRDAPKAVAVVSPALQRSRQLRSRGISYAR